MKPGSTTIKSILNTALDTNSGDILKVSTGGRQGVKSILILITLRTTLRTRELDI